MVERVLERAGPGEIVLFHNAGRHTPEAVRTLLPKLKAAGYEVVPISQLIYRENYIIESHSGVQKQLPGAAPPGGRRRTVSGRRGLRVRGHPEEPLAAVLAVMFLTGLCPRRLGDAGGGSLRRPTAAPATGFPHQPVREVRRRGRPWHHRQRRLGRRTRADAGCVDQHGVKATFS